MHNFIFFQKVLAAHGATKISAYVTHGIFPNRSWERFEHDNGGTACSALLHFHFFSAYLVLAKAKAEVFLLHLLQMHAF